MFGKVSEFTRGPGFVYVSVGFRCNLQGGHLVQLCQSLTVAAACAVHVGHKQLRAS